MTPSENCTGCWTLSGNKNFSEEFRFCCEVPPEKPALTIMDRKMRDHRMAVAGPDPYLKVPITGNWPCCGRRIAKGWEQSRDACGEGRVSTCVSEGICLRIIHAASCVFDSGACLTAPILCAGGVLAFSGAYCGAGACCVLSCCYGCCGSENGRQNVWLEAEKASRFANAYLYNCCKFGAVLCGIEACDLIKCPANLLCPEIVNAFCFQQELNAQFNRAMQWI